jgi:hypothetical protein
VRGARSRAPCARALSHPHPSSPLCPLPLAVHSHTGQHLSRETLDKYEALESQREARVAEVMLKHVQLAGQVRIRGGSREREGGRVREIK